MGTWYEAAAAAIHKATEALPADLPLDERIKVVDAAYPFGARELFPYKKWLQARRHYLVRFGYRPRGPQPDLPLLSPLDRAKAATEKREARVAAFHADLEQIESELDRRPPFQRHS